MKNGKIVIDYDSNEVFTDSNVYSFDSKEAFDIISDAYLKSGWQNKHVYSFTWLGRPIIQLPEDLIRIQEIIYRLKPDFIIETGIAHGGSLIFYASLCKCIGTGKVIGVDIDIRKHNREAIESHELFDLITMHEGSSTDPTVISLIEKQILGSKIENPKVLVLLDGCHTYEHTLNELNLYSRFVNIGSYIIACDGGIMQKVSELNEAIKSSDDWATNNPKVAAETFASNNVNFSIVEPEFLFNEGNVSTWHSYWQGGVLRRNT